MSACFERGCNGCTDCTDYEGGDMDATPIDDSDYWLTQAYGEGRKDEREKTNVLLSALQEIAGMTFDPWTNGARAGEIARAALKAAGSTHV